MGEKGVMLHIAASNKMILPIWVDGNRKSVTIQEAISSEGQALPLIIIYKSALHSFTHTSSGYTNDDLTYQ